MKIIMLHSFVLIGCILIAGCVQIRSIDSEKANVSIANVSTVTPGNTFIPFSNGTAISNTTNTSAPPLLKGLLKISLDSWIGEFPVSIDNVSAGVVKTARPLVLMIDEGNHTVDVCCGVICEQENITIRFGEHRTIDFSERLEENCEFMEPTVRIVDYYRNGDEIDVNLEFINPTTRPLTMSAEVSSGYSYIDSITNNRVGSLAQGQMVASVNAGNRITKILNLDLAYGYDYRYDRPIITKVSSK